MNGKNSATNDTAAQSIRAAAMAYTERGYALAAWHRKYGKGPRGTGWGLKAANPARLSETQNIGVNHSLSGTIALDLDHLEASRSVLAAWGVDVDALLNDPSVPCWYGNPSRRKYLFRAPEGELHGVHKLAVRRDPTDKKSELVNVFELRGPGVTAGGVPKQAQDVLPPSIHPDTGEPYKLLRDLPPIDQLAVLPPALLELWRNWDQHKAAVELAARRGLWQTEAGVETAQEQVREIGAADLRRLAAGVRVMSDETQWLIADYNVAVGKEGLDAVLSEYGYQRKGDRWLHPNSTTGIAGLVYFPQSGKVYSHSGDDLGDGKPHDSFDVMRLLVHGGDWQKAFDHARKFLAEGKAKQAGIDRATILRELLEERSRPLDLATLTTRPPGPAFVWRNYMSRGTVTIVSAIGGLGKSQVAIAHGLHSSCGLSFLGESTEGGQRVWYVSLEDSPDAVKLRVHNAVQALVDEQRDARKFESGPKTAFEIHTAVIAGFRYVDLYGAEFRVALKVQGELMPMPDLDELAARIEREGGADLVYVDTLIRSHSADENANDQMARVLVCYEGFARRLNAAVGLLVHVPKAGGDARTSHVARGAGAITDNARSAINITPAKLADVKGFTNVQPEWLNEENPRLLRITHGKSNYAGRASPRWALLREGWVVEFLPIQALITEDELNYTKLYDWWIGPRNTSKPVSRTSLRESLPDIQVSGLELGRNRMEKLLAFAIQRNLAVPVVDIASKNPAAKLYTLRPLEPISDGRFKANL